MIIFIDNINELKKDFINRKNKIIINSDKININTIFHKIKNYDYKIKILKKNYYMEDLLAFSNDFAILCNGCYIIYDEEFIGYKKDTAENKINTLEELEKISNYYKVPMGITIGSLSKNIFDKKSKINIKIDKYILTRLLDAYNGGIIYKPTKAKSKNIIEYDRRSAYPYQLQNKKFMLGNFFIYNKPISELYVINFNFIKIELINKVYNILENMKVKKVNNQYIMTITNIEFDYLIKNYKITGLKINYYINSTIIDYIDDGDFIDRFYKLKQNAKSQSEKTASKLILNSLVGKLAQRKSNITDRDIREYTLPLSVFVNAYQRIELVNIINQNIENIVYSDTDSVFSNKKINLKIDKSIGSWKVEKQIKKLSIFGKRQYIADSDQHIAGLATELNTKQISDLHKLEEKQAYNVKNINKRNELLGVYTIRNTIKGA